MNYLGKFILLYTFRYMRYSLTNKETGETILVYGIGFFNDWEYFYEPYRSNQSIRHIIVLLGKICTDTFEDKLIQKFNTDNFTIKELLDV